uniref:Rim9 protein n=1 Tax=Ganoderma boninense TaxID=34458 RepID=A0A5K1JWJ9_9APHY|nr:Rim9 protein [Ganoderma boninense]
MGLLRPATPGFLVTLAATILLAVVSFNVPIIKSIYFLKATITESDQTGIITLGTLGYCLDLNGNQTCSKPAVGYKIDINALLDNTTKIQIPEVLVKWITYALVLHIVALILAGISAVFGLLAHVREMSMAYCSTCVSGFSAAVALVAFIFDVVLFFLTRTRVNDSGGHAEIGTALWLTLAAWVLLFFAGCFYGLGRCCIRRRPRGFDREARPNVDTGYAEQVRLEAVKAEADRKARQAAGKNEVGLPAFQEYERQPLTSKSDEHEQFVEEAGNIVPYHVKTPSNGAGLGAGTAAYARQGNQQTTYAGGYAQAAPGNRSVDAYYNNSAPTAHPVPARQGSTHTQSAYSDPYAPSIAPAAVAGATAAGGYLAADAYGQYGHQQQLSAASGYGHGPRGTSSVSQPDGSAYNTGAAYNTGTGYNNVVDPFAAQPSQTQFNPDTYNASSYMYGQVSASSPQSAVAAANTNPYRATPERNYTLGGGGYGANVVPALDQNRASPAPSSSVYSATTSTMYPINTSVSPPPMPQPASPRGPREPATTTSQPLVSSPVQEQPPYNEAPPMYDAATAQPPGQWGAKH